MLDQQSLRLCDPSAAIAFVGQAAGQAEPRIPALGVRQLVLDGQPYPAFYAFLLSELIGGILIFIYSRKTLASA